MPDNNVATRVLVVSALEEDHDALRRVLKGPQWTTSSARSLLEAWITLHQEKIDVVLTECEFEAGMTWRDLVEEIGEMQNPPPVIVASRLADNTLWAEVLNRGGYDLLRKPFDVIETLHTLTMACSTPDSAYGFVATGVGSVH